MRSYGERVQQVVGPHVTANLAELQTRQLLGRFGGRPPLQALVRTLVPMSQAAGEEKLSDELACATLPAILRQLDQADPPAR